MCSHVMDDLEQNADKNHSNVHFKDWITGALLELD